MESKNKFQSDEERLDELEQALQRVADLIKEGRERAARTLAKDVLSRYERDLKFVTAEKTTEELGGLTLTWIDD